MERTASRLWKRLSRDERLAAASHFWKDPPPQAQGSALAAIVKARHVRPQAARALPPEEQARVLASILDPGEAVAASLLVALHLGERRGMLTTFLDAVGLPHEDGLLKEEADSIPLTEEGARAGVAALAVKFPRADVEAYLNTLWLQDPGRWALLERSLEWL